MTPEATPAQFYKFTSVDTAMRVIESKAFRWTSPVKFNDPFDHQAGFGVDLDPTAFAKEFTESFERIVFSDCLSPLVYESDRAFAAGALQLRNIRHRLPRESLLSRMQEIAADMAQQLPLSINQLAGQIRDFLCHSRVFCVSERNDNIVMWSHYADSHRGVVFGLDMCAETDHPLRCARKVIYADRLIPFPAAREYAMHLTGEARIDLAALSWDLAFTKHVDWSYEREWRVHLSLLGEPPEEGFTDYRENPPAFQSMYLGCRMEPEARAQIISHARAQLPAMRIFQASPSDTSFALTFEELAV